MRDRFDLSGYWRGSLELHAQVDSAAPKTICRDFYVPLAWNLQIQDFQWPSQTQELSAITRPIQNQNFTDKERKFSEGVVTYRRTVVLDRKPGMREFLVFEGSNYKTTVFINGHKVGECRNGHLAFEFDVHDVLVHGENRFEIVVDNRRDKEACPQEQFNWKNYGGIYRPIFIEYRPKNYLKDYRVLPRRTAHGWAVEVRVSLSRAMDATAKLGIVSGGEQREVEVAWSDCTEARVELNFDEPVVWEIGQGNLSEIELILFQGAQEIDRVDGKFGFRTVEVRGRDILINGRKVRLLGAAFHEQHPAFGNSVPAWQWVRDLQLLKYSGLNAVRAAHYPYSRGFYDACDREGVLCLAELPCWQFNGYHFANPGVLQLCRDRAREMVLQLGNHPSIIGWIVQNESKTFESGSVDFFSGINSVFKSLDPTRFTISAENPEPPEHLAVVKKIKGVPTHDVPPTSGIIDAMGINDYSGWYGEKSTYLPELIDHVTSKITDRPVIITEFGAEATPGQRSLQLTKYSEDFQSELLCRHIHEILKRKNVAGFFIWLFFDYEGSSISIAGINAKGLVDLHRRPKLAFNMVKGLLERHEENSG